MRETIIFQVREQLIHAFSVHCTETQGQYVVPINKLIRKVRLPGPVRHSTRLRLFLYSGTRLTRSGLPTGLSTPSSTPAPCGLRTASPLPPAPPAPRSPSAHPPPRPRPRPQAAVPRRCHLSPMPPPEMRGRAAATVPLDTLLLLHRRAHPKAPPPAPGKDLRLPFRPPLASRASPFTPQVASCRRRPIGRGRAQAAGICSLARARGVGVPRAGGARALLRERRGEVR